LDYVVAAAAGWLTGTFGSALEAREIPAGEGRLISEAKGAIEKDGKVLVIRRIHVIYQLKLKPEQQATAQKVHGFHADFCPVARSIKGSIDVSTELNCEDI
jgi:organic hydroperoxide reductase OsmC/OhrA